MSGHLLSCWFPKRGVSRAADVKKPDNRGFSLVELIVSVAILGIISTILTSFLQTSGFLYRRVSGNSKLQVQSQLFLSQIQEYVLDANAGLYRDDSENALYVFDNESAGLICRKFRLDTSGNMIYYSKSDPLAAGITGAELDLELNAVSRRKEMAGNVEAFNTIVNHTDSNVDSVVITVSFELQHAAKENTLILSPRNRPLTDSDLDALLAALTA